MRGEPPVPARPRAEATERTNATDGADRETEGVVVSLRRLKLLGVVAPIIFGVAIETFRFSAVTEAPLARAEHLAIAAVTGVGVVCFSFLMFALIERAQRQVMRQNRELAAMTAVSTAVQGELGVEQLIDAALLTVVEATGAAEASVTVFSRGATESGLERTLRGPSASSLAHAAPSLGGVPHLIDIPLSSGTAVLGRMRLHLPGEVAEPDLLASATLQNIGHQLACAIQIGQLVADLQRRKSEGHGLYDILLRISNQAPLDETLAAVARHACELVPAAEATVSLTATTAAAAGLPADEGEVVVRHAAEPDGDAAPAEAGLGDAIELPLDSPDMVFGRLSLRRDGAPFTGREHGFASTLAQLASIAIAGAQARETEQLAAVVAERERIAREMHDSLAQVLGVTHLRLLALRPRADGLMPADAAQGIGVEIDELALLAEEAYRDVREAILGLREAAHVDRSFTESLRAYLEKYSRQSGVAASLENLGDGEPRLSPRAEVQVIRVVQEALTNVRKHAGAASAVVRIEASGGWTTVTIEDDGRGFDLGGRLLDRDSGFGLHTMRERMELLGGTLTIDSAKGNGTRVIARLPAAATATVAGGRDTTGTAGQNVAIAAS